jgi:trehalose utilization protein
MHAVIAAGLAESQEFATRWRTLQQQEHGLTERRCRDGRAHGWGHKAHAEVAIESCERCGPRWEGMGLLVLHSGHFSKIFKR